MTTIDMSKLAVYFLADMSTSMDEKDGRLMNAREVGVTLAEDVAELDDNGMIHFVTFGGRVVDHGEVDLAKIEEFYKAPKPRGTTPMAKALLAIEAPVARRMTGSEAAHQLVIILTDGEPDNKQDVIKALVTLTVNVTSQSQIAFLFVQVGTDQGAKDYLDLLDNSAKSVTKGIDLVKTLHFSQISDYGVAELVELAFNG